MARASAARRARARRHPLLREGGAARRGAGARLLPLGAAAAARHRAAWPAITPLIAYPTVPPPAPDAPYQLLVDQAPSPALGVERAAPQLSWAVPASVPVQTAARVTVLTGLPAPAAVVWWDSGWVNTSAPSLAYGGPRMAPATRYTWSVQVRGDTAESAASAPAVLITGLQGRTAAATAPLWAPNASASFVFLRAEVPLRSPASQVAWAAAFITAAPQVSVAQAESDNSKLLGAYKLWVNGAVVGMGPGKPSRCGPLCPVQGARGVCTCAPEQLYDTRDVTPLVAAAAGHARGDSDGATVTLAVAAFNYPPASVATLPTASRVLLELHVAFADGGTQVVGTEAGSGAWRAWDATPYMRPSGNFGVPAWYVSPRENFDARAEPAGWREPGFDASAWGAAAAVEPFGAPLVAKPAEAVRILEGPADVARPAAALLFNDSTVLFVDFGVDFSGGVCLDVLAGVAGTALLVALGEEELDAGGGANATRAVRPMRTGNGYSQEWVLRDGPQTICMHEWAQFRYAQLTALPPPPAGPATAAPPPSPPPPPSLAPMGLAVRAWVLLYPAPLVPSSSFSVAGNGAPAGPGGAADAAAVAGVWALSWYTRAAQTLDMYYDHVRQRDVYCVEELTVDLLQQYALSAEYRVQPFVLEYVLNNRPASLGWAEWPALVLFSVHEIWQHTGDLALFRAHYAQLRNFTGFGLPRACGRASPTSWTAATPRWTGRPPRATATS